MYKISTPSQDNQFQQIFMDPGYKQLKISFCRKILTDLKFRNSPNCARLLINEIESLVRKRLSDTEIYREIRNYVHNKLYISEEYKRQIGNHNGWSRSRNRQEQIENMLKLYLTKRKIDTYLDIGCNEGSITSAVAEILDASCVYGCDIFKPVKVDNSFNFVLLDLNSYYLPFENDSQDVVTAFMSLHHIKEVETTLKEVGRILKPNGIFIIREHDCQPKELSVLLDLMHGFYSQVWEDEKEMENFKEHYACYRTKNELTEIIEKSGSLKTIYTSDVIGVCRYFYKIFTKNCSYDENLQYFEH